MHMNGDMEIGERVRKFRLLRGLSQKELGDRVNVSQTSIARLESGQTMVSVFTLIEIAKELQVSAGILLSEGTAFDETELSGLMEKLKKFPAGKRQEYIRIFEQIMDINV